MLKRQSSKVILLFTVDVILIIVCFYVSYAIRHKEFVEVFSFQRGATVISLFILICVFYIADIYGYKSGFFNFYFIVRLFVAIVVATGLIAAAFYALHPWRYSRVALLLDTILIFNFLLIWRIVFDRIVRNGKNFSRVLIVGAGQSGKRLYDTLQNNDSYEVSGFLDDDVEKKGMVIGSSAVIGNTKLLPSLIKDKSNIMKIDIVVVAITHYTSSDLLKRIIDIKFNGVETYDMPVFYENITGKIPILHISDRWFGYANIYGVKRNLYNTKIKKNLDKIVAIFILIVTFPITIVSIIAIKLSSKGPVFFRQKRVGEGMKIFEVVKFRTMRFGCEEERILAGSKDDPRITKVGKILRFFRIDEIPQFWNVLKGNMSVVGPRALIEEEVDEFSKMIPYFSLRHSVRPGITGWAQVNYKHGINIEDGTEKLQYDMFYIKNLTPVIDFHILLKTIRVTLLGKGAR